MLLMKRANGRADVKATSRRRAHTVAAIAIAAVAAAVAAVSDDERRCRARKICRFGRRDKQSVRQANEMRIHTAAVSVRQRIIINKITIRNICMFTTCNRAK